MRTVMTVTAVTVALFGALWATGTAEAVPLSTTTTTSTTIPPGCEWELGGVPEDPPSECAVAIGVSHTEKQVFGALVGLFIGLATGAAIFSRTFA